MEPVRSARNARVAAAIRLHRVRERKAAGETLLEGPHLLGEALTAGVEIRRVFALANDRAVSDLAGRHGLDLVTVTQDVLTRLAPTRHPRGPVAVMAVPPSRHVAGPVALVLWGLAEPGNVGTAIRGAAAFGAAVVVGGGGAEVWSPKVLRAAAGGHFRTSIEVLDAPSPVALAERGYKLAAAVVSGGRPPWTLPDDKPVALMVGNEAHGLDESLVDMADARITVPMPGATESLNAAMAATVVLYELAARRLREGDRPAQPSHRSGTAGSVH